MFAVYEYLPITLGFNIYTQRCYLQFESELIATLAANMLESRGISGLKTQVGMAMFYRLDFTDIHTAVDAIEILTHS